MQVPPFYQAIQDFIWAVSYEKFNEINVATADEQAQALDHLIQLLQYCKRPDTNTPKEVHILSEFFAIPGVEKFFTALFANLHEKLFLKAKAVFLSGLAFIVEYIGLPKSRETVYLLLEKLQERFPALRKMYDEAIETVKTEFFKPTIGELLNQNKSAVIHFKTSFPNAHELFVDPLNAAQFLNRKLFIFYCNPWIYHPITNYLTHHAHLSSPEINRELIEKPIEKIEECLRTIRSQTNDESWQELIHKAHKLCEHSASLEAFAIECAGLLGEIKTAAQFIKNNCRPKDILVFLSESKGGGKNCDLMVIRHGTDECELIECKAKSPRHGLDPKLAEEAQIWDDFFSNFVCTIYSYLYYLQSTIQPLLGLKLLKCFPLFSNFEGSSYGTALPLIDDILMHQAITDIPLKKWPSEKKLTHLLCTLFLSPLVLNTPFTPLASDEARLTQRQQDVKEVLQKDWVNTILQKAIRQLEEAHQRQIDGGHQIAKMYVALDLLLSYRLLQDPFSGHDGNIEEIAEQTLHEAFKPFKNAFSSQDIALDLLIIKP